MTDDVAIIGKNFFYIFHGEGCVLLPPLPPCPQSPLFHLLDRTAKSFCHHKTIVKVEAQRASLGVQDFIVKISISTR
jgi:hypothetical protein